MKGKFVTTQVLLASLAKKNDHSAKDLTPLKGINKFSKEKCREANSITDPFISISKKIVA